MGQAPESPPHQDAMLSSSPLNWDGKCLTCRKLMSRCVCFQESESDLDPLHPSPNTPVTADAAETRPLWNALRKMHRKSVTPQLALVQPPTSSSSNSSSRDQHRKRSEALPPLSASTRTSSTSSARHHLHRRSDARPPTSSSSSRRGSREPRPEPLPERPSTSRKDRLQRAGITTSSHNLKRDAVKDAGVMRSVQSTSSMDKRASVSLSKEKLVYEPEGGSDEDDETVWEL